MTRVVIVILQDLTVLVGYIRADNYEGCCDCCCCCRAFCALLPLKFLLILLLPLLLLLLLLLLSLIHQFKTNTSTSRKEIHSWLGALSTTTFQVRQSSPCKIPLSTTHQLQLASAGPCLNHYCFDRLFGASTRTGGNDSTKPGRPTRLAPC